MNVSDIITEFGAFYIKNEANKGRVATQLYSKFKTTEMMTKVLTDDTIYRAAEARMTRVLQAFQKAFTPLNPLSFKPVSIPLYKMKVDVSEYPDDLEATWLGFLADNDTNRQTWPFVKWWIETQLLPKMKEDLELYEIYHGVRVEPTAGTAGAQGASMTGLKKQIVDFIAANRIVPYAMGVPNADPETFCEQVEAFADNINTKYWGIPMEISLNPSLERRFLRGYKAKYGDNVDYKKPNSGSVEFTNLTVVGKESMIGSNRIFCTPKENMVYALKRQNGIEQFNVEQEDRKVKFFTDFWMGAGFVIPEIVFCNDQA